MSTDSQPESLGAVARQKLRFSRLTVGLILVLALVATGLGVINAVQGPRLSFGEVNPQALITRAAQRLILHANQPLAAVSADKLTIFPTATVGVSTDDNAVTLQFATSLNYHTEYSVSVDVRSASTGIEGKLEFSFTTPDIDVYSLLRDTENSESVQDNSDQDNPDQVLRHSLAGANSNSVVFEAPKIQEYARLIDRIAVVTLDEENAPTLMLTQPSQLPTTVVDTANASVIRQLRSDDSGTIFGYVLGGGQETAEGPSSRLFLYDLTNGTGLPEEITGFAGRPLTVMNWMFVPGTTSIVVQADDQQLYLIEAAAREAPTPLGQHMEMRGFIPNTLQLVVADPLSGSLIDLASGTTTVLDLPEPELLADRYPGKLVLLDERRFIELFTLIGTDAAGGQGGSELVINGTNGTITLFSTALTGGTIRNYCLSPNGEYLAVEVTSAEGRPDYYPSVSGFSATTVVFVRLGDGSSSRSVSGFMPDWCRVEPSQ
jgi:hypothetical protein